MPVNSAASLLCLRQSEAPLGLIESYLGALGSRGLVMKEERMFEEKWVSKEEGCSKETTV